MTMKFSLNNLTPSTTDSRYFMWEIYRFMTTASPTGPGWVSIGEGNGTSGGMGTTGLFTSATSFASQYSWFVLRSPDSKIQVLFARSTTQVYYMQYYLTTSATPFTAGSATVLPTYTTASTLIFGAINSMPSTAYYCAIHCMADNSPPYGFYAVVTVVNNAAANSRPYSYDGIFFIPLDGYETADGYPFIFTRSNGISNNIDVLTDVTYGSKAFNYNGTAKGVIQPTRLYNYTTSVGLRGSGAAYNGVFGIPLMFCSSTIYKGITYKYGWAATKQLSQCNTFNNRNYFVFGDIVIPWDGATAPIMCYNG